MAANVNIASQHHQGGCNVNSREKLRFPTRLRELRVAAGKKQHEIAAVLGFQKAGSYSNAESANHKRISRDRVILLAKFYGLDAAATEELLAFWEELPVSEWSKGQSEGAKAKRVVAVRAKAADELRFSLVEVLSLLLSVAPDPDALCSCSPPATGAGLR